jgi:hypothetical protein
LGGDVQSSGNDELYLIDGGSITAAAVPEPSTWAMTALGFSLLGLLGYRKTRSDNGLGVSTREDDRNQRTVVRRAAIQVVVAFCRRG